MKTWALLSFTACGIGLFLSGCGGGSVPAAPVAPAVSPLAGNWLIVGPMPTEFPSSGFQLTLTVDVLENKLFAAGFGNISCGDYSKPFTFPAGANGTIATDGSFSLQSLAGNSAVSLSIQGTVPKANDAPWPGNYTFSFNPQVIGLFGGVCDSTRTGEFTATSFPLVNGVYAGTEMTGVGPNGVPGTVSVQMLLQQGVMATDSPSGKRYLNNIGLTGNIRVQGSACLSTGATDPSVSGIQGNNVYAQFIMDDGSTLTLIGTLTDTTGSHISVNFSQLIGNRCGSTPLFYLPSEFDRQS
jgi:hypothetical protein